MVVNAERFNLMARQKVDRLLLSLRDNPDGLLVSDIVRQVSLEHPVSPTSIRRFIRECYVDPGYVEDFDGTLVFKKQW